MNRGEKQVWKTVEEGVEMIQISGVYVVFFHRTPLEKVALRGIDFSANSGEVISIVGNNGSGRSTLLKFLAGHISSTFGKVMFNKVDITHQSISQRSKLFSSIFYDENISTAGNLTVLENLVVASMHHQPKSMFFPAISSEIRDTFFQQLKELDFLEIEMLLDEKVCNIPKVHRHVLSLLISVIKESKVLLIDEHSVGLDKESSDALLEVTKKIIKSNDVTTIMAVNDLQFALDVSDRIIVLNNGQITSVFDTKAKNDIKPHDIFTSFGQST